MRRPSILIVLAGVVLALVAILRVTQVRSSASVAKPVTGNVLAETLHAPELAAGGEQSEAEPRAALRAEAPASIEGGRGFEPLSEAEPDPAFVVYGLVIAGRDRASSGATTSVSLVDRLGDRRTTRAGPDGAYSFPGLTPGRYWLGAGSAHEGEAHAVIDLDASRPERRVDLELQRRPEVLVRVVDRAGDPVDGTRLLAIATREEPGPWFDEIRGSWNNPFGVGRFLQDGYQGTRLPSGCIGRIVLDVEPPLFVSLLNFQRVLETRPVEAGDDEVSFVLESSSPLLRTASIRARFVDAETRLPVAKGHAMLESRALRTVRVDDEGRCVFTEISPGLALLRLSSVGYERLDRLIRVEAGEELDLGDVPVGRGLEIAGRVVDEDGAGVAAGIRFELVAPGSDAPVRIGSVWTVKSEPDGSFRVPGLPPRRVILSIRGEENEYAATTRVVDLRNGSLEGLRIELVRGVPLLVRAADERWREVAFTIRDVRGEPVLEHTLWSPAPHRIQLAPGRYSIEVRRGAEVRELTISLEREPFELALP